METALPSLPDIARLFGLAPPRPRHITRRFFAQVRQGATREVAPLPGTVTVHCRNGEAWITHDGDPRDVFLRPSQSYVADTRNRMTVHALRGDCVMEFEVVEEVRDPPARA
ncbi:DUF2917 domain-containing protein [Ramlibacter sp. USB13]|uniref:DUF2917 domain-containing protein n=1 Tax=Ramlibacter cellulosilyticus TaxID=2764187 RepID=A0A923MSR4_9BURK|nr:DUF2917 domain-containing protein [Ramlibacter cellulosilyticus]MBC5783142.1 DUF2917 domain-containing protein [Ramlibacter cellulosilyticus]